MDNEKIYQDMIESLAGEIAKANVKIANLNAVITQLTKKLEELRNQIDVQEKKPE